MKNIPTIVRNLGTINIKNRVGFSSVPDQVRESSMARGFELNVLAVGRRGLGTSTLINSIFAAPLVDKKRPNTITVTRNEIVENDISLDISIVTYHELDISPVLDYINAMNREYFDNEQGLYKTFKDNRIHVCLYLLPSDTLTDQEIKNMYELSQCCNLVPIIPKADMYTPDELACVKESVKQILSENNIFFFVPYFNENDGDLTEEITDIVENMPFAVIASETMYEHGGEIVRGRKYIWGFINIDLEESNDFKRLQRLLIYTNLDELVTKTNHMFYNTYRKKIFDIEKDCGAMKEARYLKLRTETIRILNDKYESRIKALREEEIEMERFYNEKLSEGGHEINDLGKQVEKSLQVE
ncbi:septin-like protein [Encephalitozoon intestinalis ATCC 50506]|uniref:Septin-like protein n=1 Tax=Encephalitozoon intestinalis (strain ATCC 50506) TaxID=876142 RepID=E0SA62_ENCIT|nr:septin-like protein [Encephalitozoon intestinalis ATCC 50506]ADM12684.2 septin-like protein [Encephalitozoon intestinalis ATCC 50506]UTX46546.1 septin-like protein [Encephalitozoon intestinalis]